MMESYERFDVSAPKGVTFTDGPARYLASDGVPYMVYGFVMHDVLPPDVEKARVRLIEYYQQWLNGFCLSHGVKNIEWRTRPDIAVQVKRRTKNQRADIRVYSRFHSAEADDRENLLPDSSGMRENAGPARFQHHTRRLPLLRRDARSA